jgi:hypothetical protein
VIGGSERYGVGGKGGGERADDERADGDGELRQRVNLHRTRRVPHLRKRSRLTTADDRDGDLDEAMSRTTRDRTGIQAIQHPHV